MNWGKWIVVSFVLFAGFIATLVTVCVRQDVSLVAKDYYREELTYQQQIERINNTAALVSPPVISIVDDKFIMISFDRLDQISKGQLLFFRPSDEKFDRKFELKKGDKKFQVFKLDKTQKGMYRAKLHWEMDGKEYYLEEMITI